jgi:hypothetical protein
MHARIEEGQVKLLTRTGLDWSHRYRSTIEALPSLEMSLSATPIQDGNTSRPHRGDQVGTAQALPKAAILLFAMMTATIVLSLALPASAQDKVFRVGLLTNGNPPKEGQQSTWRSGVLLGLDSGGYRLGRNLELVERYSEGRAYRLPGMAREIAVTNVNVVVAVAYPSVQAMMTATQSTPLS